MNPGAYRPAWWIPGGHLRTLWGKVVGRPPVRSVRRERWDTPDGDFLDLYRLDGPERSPRLVVLHGLEGSADSHYARGLVAQASAHGWAADVIVFRSCGETPNRKLRFYHSGDTADLDFVISRLVASDPHRQIALAGVSLGGNVLLKWLGERGRELPASVIAAAAISVPFDLGRGVDHIDRGFSRVYQAYFLRSLRRKAHEKRRRFPNRLDKAAINRARTLRQFDDVVTAPLHGFRDANEYYLQSSSIHWIDRIQIPTLLLSAMDDPFLPSRVLIEVSIIARQNPNLVVQFVDYGGHVGFVGGRVPWKPFYYGEWRAVAFVGEHIAQHIERGEI